MMINKRLIAMVPEVKPFIFKKVVASWVSLLAGIVLWFTVAKTLEQVLEANEVATAATTKDNFIEEAKFGAQIILELLGDELLKL